MKHKGISGSNPNVPRGEAGGNAPGRFVSRNLGTTGPTAATASSNQVLSPFGQTAAAPAGDMSPEVYKAYAEAYEAAKQRNDREAREDLKADAVYGLGYAGLMGAGGVAGTLLEPVLHWGLLGLSLSLERAFLLPHTADHGY